MDFHTVRLLENLLLPPAGPFLVIAMGALLSAFGFGRKLLGLGILVLYAASAPYVANTLVQGLQKFEPVTPEALKRAGTEAIVVLGGGYYGEAEEYGQATVGPFFLERLRYAAWLYRQTGAPVIISSGQSDAPTAARLLVEEYGVPVRAIEDKSWTTLDNARHTVALLDELNMTRVALVTHGWHMIRAIYSFEQAGATSVFAAPMGLADPKPDAGDWHQWLPSARALGRTRTALHEYLGLFWYRNQERIETWLEDLGNLIPNRTADTKAQ